MPTVRLFAQARECAGTATLRVEGQTVGAVLETLNGRFGGDFTDVLRHARLWLNAHPIEGELTDVVVTDSDELAIVPPVSGGAA